VVAGHLRFGERGQRLGIELRFGFELELGDRFRGERGSLTASALANEPRASRTLISTSVPSISMSIV
jgi:hypothetical protein